MGTLQPPKYIFPADAHLTPARHSFMQRTSGRTSRTAEGTAFVVDCQRILRELADAEGAVSVGGAQATGRLRITAPAGFGRQFVAPMIARFALAQPQTTVALELSDRIVDVVADGFDCAIRFGKLADSPLVRVNLGASRRVIVAAPAYLKRHGVPSYPDELSRHACMARVDANAPGGQLGWALHADEQAVTDRQWRARRGQGPAKRRAMAAARATKKDRAASAAPSFLIF